MVSHEQELYDELSGLDLEEVLEYFSRTVAEMHAAGEKLDDKMQPLTESQCGSVAQSTDRELAHYESLSLTEISQSKVGILLLAGGQRGVTIDRRRLRLTRRQT